MSREPKAVEIRKQLIKFYQSANSLTINELRIVLAIERVVARLEYSAELRSHLVFKGGFVLLKVLESDRFTRDLDALCKGIDKNDAQDLIKEALLTDLDDGFWFGEIRIQNMEEQGEYGALRFDCAYFLGDPPKEKLKLAKLSRVHFDVGFGDKVIGKLSPIKSPALLPNGHPLSWKVYPLESIYSEKLETLVQRGDANSRAKDIYDMTMIFDACKDTEKLSKAILATFKTRSTEMPESFSEFAANLNLRQLKSSWGSVQLSETDATFESFWELLLTQFKKLDRILT